MIPTTVATLVGFLLFVAPGLLWEMLVERRKPNKDESAFREASRVAVVSAPFSTAAVAATLALAYWLQRQWLSDVTTWIRTGRPPTNASVLVGAVLAVVELAITGALLAVAWWLLSDRLYGTGKLLDESAWTFALKKGSDGQVVRASVHLLSGDQLLGSVLSFTPDHPWADRELTLGQPLSVLKPDGLRVPLFGHCLAVPASSIEYVTSMIAPQQAVDAVPRRQAEAAQQVPARPATAEVSEQTE